jgi:hypothetical protein
MSFWQSEKTTMSHVVSPHRVTTAKSKPRARHLESPEKYGRAKRATRASVRKNRRFRVVVVVVVVVSFPPSSSPSSSSRDRVDASSASLGEGFAAVASRRAAPRRARSVPPTARADMVSRARHLGLATGVRASAETSGETKKCIHHPRNATVDV